ncbi:protein phosphatase [Fibrisoma limi BUZ 3]|uniref:Protein phosphatase n=1 Tax=Fibrisoma limi BUZ 3 TaxID=1185876 RepID=I2GJS9_9BACT|nr:protein phosphatase 2C domain-containing protein [Fibrisoma limi]CCH54154.1 protein phosphatase [Fibrisoma limi BUZ 3]
MHIQPAQPFAFSYTGQRTINQDALYPAVGTADEQAQLFVVCDGMGGADKGEVASQLLCTAIVEYAATLGYPTFDEVHIQTALDRAYEAYYGFLRQHPLVNRMGSTFAMLQLHSQGATIAHIGDSRVYQFRDGKIIFRTQDHKQVNDMVEAGIITATQALSHPWRNRLSRAVVASSSDTNEQSARSKPDVTFIKDIHVDDYFFLCTDGVYEQLDDLALEGIMASNIPDQAKVQSLLAMCEGETRDNYSGYLVGVKSVTETKTLEPAIAS